MQGNKFVVDNMLGKLTREMRSLGIDTAAIGEKNYERLLEIAQLEERIVITSDLTFFYGQQRKAAIYLVKGKKYNDNIL
jgi:uncharacterized protein with PIN domain